MSEVSSVVVGDRKPQSTNKTFDPFRTPTVVPASAPGCIEDMIRGVAESLSSAVINSGIYNRPATAMVNRERACSQREKEIERQIERISPYIRWVTEGGNSVPADDKFQDSARAAIGLLSASLCSPAPVPTSSVDIEKGASLFLNDDISYFDIECFGNLIEFYARDKSNGVEFYGEEEVHEGVIPPSLLATFYKLYARNK